MKRISFLILVITFFLTSCTYQANKRPERNNNEIWICEEPYLELYWTENKFGGKLVFDETEYAIVHTQTHGARIWIYEDDENLDLSHYSKLEYCLFNGKADYGKEKMTITVDVDYKNIFGGKKPTFELVKHVR